MSTTTMLPSSKNTFGWKRWSSNAAIAARTQGPRRVRAGAPARAPPVARWRTPIRRRQPCGSGCCRCHRVETQRKSRRRLRNVSWPPHSFGDVRPVVSLGPDAARVVSPGTDACRRRESSQLLKQAATLIERAVHAWARPIAQSTGSYLSEPPWDRDPRIASQPWLARTPNLCCACKSVYKLGTAISAWRARAVSDPPASSERRRSSTGAEVSLGSRSSLTIRNRLPSRKAQGRWGGWEAADG